MKILRIHRKILLGGIRSDLEKGKDFRDKCQSLPYGKPFV